MTAVLGPQVRKQSEPSRNVYGVFPHSTGGGTPSGRGWVARQGTADEDGSVSWPAPYRMQPVKTYKMRHAAERHAGKMTATDPTAAMFHDRRDEPRGM